MRIVVKIGSSSLVDPKGGLQDTRIVELVADLADLSMAGHDIVLVSSGAIAAGLGVLGKDRRPSELPALQAASAVGQGALYATWASAFATRELRTAQVLLTMHDVSHRSSYINARNTLEQLLSWRVISVVNENDTTATDEITFGDNDTLAAQVAVLIHADLLVLLTDTDGLYTEHPDSPGAQLIEQVDDHSLLHRVDTAQAGSHWGSGGMRSKVIAAEMASTGGVATVICKSTVAQIVSQVVGGASIGTRVAPAPGKRGSSFKLWLRYAKQASGTVFVDEGARRALVSSGASLLPVGVQSVEGTFSPGDAVCVATTDSGEFGKGIVEYSAAELGRLIGDKEQARGAMEAVHRDQLVLYE